MLAMKRPAAFISAFLLLAVVTVCPLLACPLKTDSRFASKSCCHKSQCRPAPCPQPAAQNCPYLTLERGKTTPVNAQILAGEFMKTDRESQVPDRFSPVQVLGRTTDSTRLFLRNRVLLI